MTDIQQLNNPENSRSKKVKSVLSIAGFDGTAGAGSYADAKSIAATGCYATHVLSCLSIQNGEGVQDIHYFPNGAIQQQLEAVFADIYPDSIKVGLLPQQQQMQEVADFLADYKGFIVVDPVMVSSSGHALMKAADYAFYRKHIFPIASVLCPNLDELGLILEKKLTNLPDMQAVENEVRQIGIPAVLVKGGHVEGDQLTAMLIQQDAETNYIHSQRIASENTRGTGCALSSALASYLALGHPLLEACQLASQYVHQAIVCGQDLALGKSRGPLDHFFTASTLLRF